MSRTRPPPPFLMYEADPISLPWTIPVDDGGAWSLFDVPLVEINGQHWSVSGSTVIYDQEVGSFAFSAASFDCEPDGGAPDFEVRSTVNGIPIPESERMIPFANNADRKALTTIAGLDVPTGGPFVFDGEIRKVSGGNQDLVITSFNGWIHGRWKET